MLLAASEDDEGEPSPDFLNEVRRRRQAIAEGGLSSLAKIWRAIGPRAFSGLTESRPIPLGLRS